MSTCNNYYNAIKTNCTLGMFPTSPNGATQEGFFQEGLKFGPGNGLCSNGV